MPPPTSSDEMILQALRVIDSSQKVILQQHAEIQKSIGDLRTADHEHTTQRENLVAKLEELTAAQKKVADMLEDEAKEKLRLALAERDELKGDKKHWLRYVVTAIVSLITGGGLLLLGRAFK